MGKDIKKTLKHPKKIFAWEALLFLVTLSLGVLNSYRINQVIDFSLVKAGQSDLLHLAVYFVVGTAVLAGLSSSDFKRTRGVVFKVLFLLAVGTGTLLLLQFWFHFYISLLIVLALIILWTIFHSVAIHNVFVVLGIAGAGSWLGLSFTPQLVIVLLVIFSIYDFIAVYKTKHMVKMAKAMVESNAIVGLIIPSNLKDFSRDISQVQPGGKFLIVGGGDIVFPLILCTSFVPISMFKALIMVLFSLIGLGFSFWVFASQKIKKPIPALPPITLGAIMGYLITLLI
ncbi:MAG: presenilin family intramembrane aspartyl protease [Candidatus Paceibacterota bacterium]